MKTWTSSFLQLKNAMEDTTWCHCVDLVVNASTTAHFTNLPDTLTFNNVVYAAVPFLVGVSEQSGDGSLPQMTVDVSNFQGMALRFAKDNDLALNDVTIRLVNPSLTTSGQEDLIRLQVKNVVFADEAARFNLGFNFDMDQEGPRRTYNRREFPSIPHNASKFFVF
jgi:hypothetical protein